MPLSAGTHLGPYEILAPIGSGGMGEVYKARDTKLDREVAIKVLPAALARDPERLARFEREAKVLASLNHPNIAQIYGIEETDSGRALVMELAPGHTLAGPHPLSEALRIAAQIAEALEAAHDKGIVHRDLKPANDMITPAGAVKVLDFGLAAVTQPSAASGDPHNSPTLTMGATQAGMILGTAGYMAPEQAAGQAVDKRADIWSFGVILYEMLTGQRLFTGDSVAHILADVLRAPIDFDKLPAATPRAIRDLVKRCLDRDVKTRLRDIGEARIAIQNVGTEPEVAALAPSQPRHRSWLPWCIAAFLLLALTPANILHFREQPPEAPVVRTFIPPPEKTTFKTGEGNPQGPLALSPDGKRMVFSAGVSDGKDQLWVRSLDALTAKPLPGTEGAMHPFWSPDSKFIGFFGGGKLKKVDVNGGPPITLCDAPLGRGGTWSQDGVILFSPNGREPLHQVSAAGGVSSPVTELDRARGENTHRWPWFLPDGWHFVYSADTVRGSAAAAAIRVASIDSLGADSKVVVEALSNAVYAQGHLLFLREDTLVAQPFDLKRLVTTGEAVPIAENVQSTGAQRRGIFSVSGNGLLAYMSGRQIGNRLDWFDRSGKQVAMLGDAGALNYVMHFSPDRKSVAVSIVDPATGSWDIWLYDVSRGLRTRFTFDQASELEAVWSPDGKSIIFDSNRKGTADLYRKASSGDDAEELLYADKLDKSPKSWSPDGKFLLFTANGGPKTGYDNWVLPLTGERKPFPFAQTTLNERNGQFSPDGRWIAYQSDESQRNEIYVALFNGSAGAPVGKRQISTTGGAYPRWRRDGKELFYIAPDRRLMAAEVSVKGSTLEVGAVHPLFGPVNGAASFQYDVSADGQRILAVVAPEEQGTEPLTLVQNWTAALKK